jgi:hypothetical protein
VPTDAAGIVAQCFEDLAGVYPTYVSGYVTAMNGLFTESLYKWTGGVLSKDLDIRDGIGKDNGGSKGDQRSPVADGSQQSITGPTPVGAYR